MMSMFEGKWHDSVFGGPMYVCTTHMGNGDVWGQGTISGVGYLRGMIKDGKWSGKYWLAGGEAKKGKFNLRVDTTKSNKQRMRGMFNEAGSGFVAHVDNKLYNHETPDDVACFRSADYLLGSPTHHHIGGKFNGAVMDWDIWMDTMDGKSFHSSYWYTLPAVGTNPEMTFNGFELGTYKLNGQVAQAQFHENGAKEGIDLMVARDDQSFYSTFWTIPNMAHFNYSNFDPDGYSNYQSVNMKDLGAGSGDMEQAVRNYCRIFKYDAMENLCMGPPTPAAL